MEAAKKYHLPKQLHETYRSYFETYDQCNIGQITKSELFYVFKLIDPRINESWLSKIMMAQGKQVKQFINFEHFVDILQTLRTYSHEENQLN